MEYELFTLFKEEILNNISFLFSGATIFNLQLIPQTLIYQMNHVIWYYL